MFKQSVDVSQVTPPADVVYVRFS